MCHLCLLSSVLVVHLHVQCVKGIMVQEVKKIMVTCNSFQALAGQQ